MQVRRANYQALIWKKAYQATPSIPGPDGHGWKTNVEGGLEICWTNGKLMPQELADIITGPLNPSSEDEDVTVDYEDISDVVFEMTFDKLVQRENVAMQWTFRALIMKIETM